MAELCGRSEFGITGGAGASELDTTFFTEFRAVRVVVLARRTFHSAILEELRPAVSTYEPARTALMLTDLRLPTIGRLWQDFAERADKEGWPATRLLGVLLEHELAERAKRRIERHRSESQLDPTKTLASFEFAEVPMLSKAHVMALASGDAWLAASSNMV